MNNYLILHGSFSTPYSNWIPYLRKEIEDKGMEVYTPDLPSGVGKQNYSNWEQILKVYVKCGVINENTVIFAHSIAPVFICKFLVNNKIKVKRIVSVCGFNNYLGINEEYDAVNESMYFANLSDVKNYCDDIICLYSNNDPYVSFETEKNFADTISHKEKVIAGGGHLNAESGYKKFPELLNYL